MGHRYCGGVIPEAKAEGEFEAALKGQARDLADEILKLYDGMQFHIGLDKIFGFIRGINRYAEQRAPWKLAKSEDPKDRELLDSTIANMAEALRIASVMLTPVMPTVSGKILTAIGSEPVDRFEGQFEWSDSLKGKTYYRPTEQGLEARYKQRLEEIKAWKKARREGRKNP